MSYQDSNVLSSINNIINFFLNLRVSEGYQIPNYVKDALVSIEKSLMQRYELEENEILFYTYKTIYYNFSLKKSQKNELISAILQKDIDKFYNELSDEHLLHLIISIIKS